jgi:hypothetical protein
MEKKFTPVLKLEDLCILEWAKSHPNEVAMLIMRTLQLFGINI